MRRGLHQTANAPTGERASALAGGVIASGGAATIATELATPDLDLIKQAEQGYGTAARAA
jgi:hypothetical protein